MRIINQYFKNQIVAWYATSSWYSLVIMWLHSEQGGKSYEQRIDRAGFYFG